MASGTLTAVPVRSAGRRAARALAILLLVLLVLTCIAAGGFYYVATSSLPPLDGTLQLAGLAAPVTVLRDAHGVPHIRAESMSDLLFAQGCLTAQDRRWQMDMTRRYAAGEMAEVLGEGWVKHDREQRILSLRATAERAVSEMTASERARMEFYAKGVNACTENRPLDPEFRVLRYTPKAWTLVDSVLVGVGMVQNLAGAMYETEHAREKIAAKLGPELTAQLYPTTSWRDLPPGTTYYPPEDRPATTNPDEDDMEDDDSNVARAEISDDKLVPGSNNWVVSGAHTVTGKAMLSNDMHLGHQMPGVWYEAQLTAGDFDVAGVTLPGLPFVIVGHNRRIAWGFTNLGPDVQDIFIETFNAQGEYKTPQGWKKPGVRREVIHVKGGDDVSLEVETTRHGPIISELFPGEARRLALEWTLYQPGSLQLHFEQIDSAQNWTEFRKAFSTFTEPAQNVVYGDVDGHIGYQATGRIPLRAAGDGSLPVSGSDDAHEWKGYIKFDDLPMVYDPPSGVLATANGRATLDGYRYSLSTQWGPPYRVERIYRVLDSGKKLSAADMLELQTDIYSSFEDMVADQFAAAVDHSQNVPARTRRAADMLRNWDGRFTKKAAAANIVTLARRQLMDILLEAKLGPLAKEYSWDESSVWLESVLTRRPKEWLPAKYPTYDALLLDALEAALRDPRAPQELEKWRRGKQFPLELQHPIFGSIPILRRWTGPGTVEQSGSGFTVKQVGRRFGPSERMTVDFSNLDASTLNVVTGESGHIFSPYYMDQWPAWYGDTTFTLPFSDDAVVKARAHQLTLKPVGSWSVSSFVGLHSFNALF